MSKAKMLVRKFHNEKGRQKIHDVMVPYKGGNDIFIRSPSLYCVYRSYAKPGCWTKEFKGRVSMLTKHISFTNENLFLFKLDVGIAFANKMQGKPILYNADKRQKVILETLYEAKDLNRRVSKVDRTRSRRKTQYEKALTAVKKIIDELRQEGHTILVPEGFEGILIGVEKHGSNLTRKTNAKIPKTICSERLAS